MVVFRLVREAKPLGVEVVFCCFAFLFFWETCLGVVFLVSFFFFEGGVGVGRMVSFFCIFFF